MSPIREIPRAAVGVAVKAARLPVDTAVRLAGSRGEMVRNIIDRAEARVRGSAGTAMADHGMQEDAARRESAVDERERAGELREQAERKSRAADRQAAERKREAERKRKQADQRAEQQRQAAQRRRDEKQAGAAQASEARKGDAREQAAKRKQAAEEQAQEQRLEALDAKAEANDDKERALRVAEEKRRLEGAAERTKAARKQESAQS
jgi:hypothetical protein